MSKLLNRLTYTLIIISALSFILFLITSAYFVRPCSDDLWFYYEYLDKGWFNAIYEFKYNKRWVSYLTFNSICLFSKNFIELHKAFFIYHLIVYSFLLFSTTRLIRISAEFFLEIKLNIGRAFLLSIMFISALYFSTLHAQEVWFWTVANTAYLLPIPLLFIGIYEFMNKNSILSKIIIAFVFFLIGGTLENLTITISLSLIYYLSYSIKLNNRDQIKKCIIALCSIIILPILSFFGNGISNRMNLNEKSFKNQTIKYFESVFFDYELKFNTPRIIIFLSILCMIFFIANGIKDKIKNVSFNFRKLIKVNIFLLLIFSIGTYLPLIKLFGNLGSARASMPFVLFICISCCVWVFIFGLYTSFESKLFYLISSSIGTILLVSFTNKQYTTSMRFTTAFDNRVKYIISHKNNKCKYILVNQLPDSGVLASQEVGRINDKGYISSYYLGRVNGIDKDVFLK